MIVVAADNRRLIRVTGGNLRNSHLYIHNLPGFLPADCVGPSRQTRCADKAPIEVYLVGLDERVRTDVGSDPKTGRPRHFLRGRGWVARFFRFHGIRPGDLILMERTGDRRYCLRPFADHDVAVDLDAARESDSVSCVPSAFRAIELFAGAGGLALGTARAGFEHEAVVEWDSNACDTLRRNKAMGVRHVRDWEIIEGDVCQYGFRQHEGKTEFVSGGPPCQPFSLGGKHHGHDDVRNMFPEAIRAVREIRPKAFVFENVKGLLRRNFSNYYSYIIHQFEFPEVTPKGDEEWMDHLARLQKLYTGNRFSGLRYNVVFQLLNAADYGVPQRRERVLIVGIRDDLGLEFSFPLATHTEDALLHDKWVTGEYWERHRVPKSKRPKIPPRIRSRVDQLRDQMRFMMAQAWRTVRDAIADLPRIAVGHTSTKIDNHFLNPGARSYPGHTGSPFDEPAKALKAGDHGVPGGENTLRLDDGSVRYFSVRECARLQAFPDDWMFQGSWTESMRQLGNAVPVALAEVVAGHLADVLTRRGLRRG